MRQDGPSGVSSAGSGVGVGSAETRERQRKAVGTLDALATARIADKAWGELSVTLTYENGQIKRVAVTDKTTF